MHQLSNFPECVGRSCTYKTKRTLAGIGLEIRHEVYVVRITPQARIQMYDIISETKLAQHSCCHIRSGHAQLQWREVFTDRRHLVSAKNQKFTKRLSSCR